MAAPLSTDATVSAFSGREIAVLKERRLAQQQGGRWSEAAQAAAARRVAMRHAVERTGLLARQAEDTLLALVHNEAQRWRRLCRWWQRTLPAVIREERINAVKVLCMHATSALLAEESDAFDTLTHAFHTEYDDALRKEARAEHEASIAAATLAYRAYTAAETAHCQERLGEALRAVASQKRRLRPGYTGYATPTPHVPPAGPRTSHPDIGTRATEDEALGLIDTFRRECLRRG